MSKNSSIGFLGEHTNMNLKLFLPLRPPGPVLRLLMGPLMHRISLNGSERSKLSDSPVNISIVEVLKQISV